MTTKTINNPYFTKLQSVISCCFGSHLNGAVVSNIIDASLDDANAVYVYPSTSSINLSVIKLDSFSEYRKFLLNPPKGDTLNAVDAICINNSNEWFFIEFKNCDIRDNKTKKSIRKKMLESLWYVFFLYSKANEDINNLFGGDITKFAREKITYIIVGSRSKNSTLYAQNIFFKEASGSHYTPPGYNQYIGYYFKNVYMLTELELRNFILNFST